MTRKCPECGLLNDDNDWTCAYCGARLLNHRIVLKFPDSIIRNVPFTIDFFVKENFHLFAIIGVIGTMLALLPNLGEKIIGIGWLENDFGMLPIAFAIFIFSGGLLIFISFLILLKKIWNNRMGESILKQYNIHKIGFQIKAGDPQRLLLYAILVLMMAGSFYFILMAVVLIPNYPVILLSAILAMILLGSFVIYSYYDFFNKEYQTIIEYRSHEKGTTKIIKHILVTIIVLAIVVYFIAIPVTNYIVSPKNPYDVVILTDQEVYSPTGSSAVGLELYPTNGTNTKSLYPNYKQMGVRWETNYGFFVTQDRYTLNKILLDNFTVRGSSSKVYWTYSENDIPKEKSPIQIKLKMYTADGSNWTPFTNASLNLTWTNQGFARVEDFANHSISVWTIQHPFMVSD